jgi:hypothetical protein
LIAIPDYLAQTTGQVTVISILTAVICLFVVATIVGIARHPSGPGLVNLGMLFAVMYVGWAARGWPGVDGDEGLFLGVGEMWLGSIDVIWDVFWDISGLDSLAERLGVAGKSPFKGD